MRLLHYLLPFAFTTLAAATPPDVPDPRKQSVQDEEPHNTTFNGQTVPPLPMLKGDDFDRIIAHGYWLVEAFSPYCGHCKHLAPKWQTLYEFYTTSDPLPASLGDHSFGNYYDMKWGKLDCVAWADTCNDLDIKMFPTILLFKDGLQVKNKTGDRAMDELSSFIESSLETIRPGSRPEGGVLLPEVGANGTGLIEGKDTAEAGTGAVVAKKTDSTILTDPDASSPASKSFAQLLPSPYDKSVSLSPPNPSGLSVPLDATNFSATVSQTLDPWFIKFYAPWCHHCQALAPSWEQMAKDVEGKLNIGEVDCDAQRALCKENGVKYYPTLKLMRGPETIEYQGLRGVQDITTFATEAGESLTDGVPDVTAADFARLEKKHDVIFVYFYDHATTTEDFMALERLPLHTLGHARLVKSSDTTLAARFKVVTFPRLLVAKDGASTQYPKLMPKEMRDIPALSKWIKQNWLPLVPELDSNNARDVMTGKYAVLALLDHARPDEWSDALREMKAVAIDWAERTQKEFEAEREQLRDKKEAKVQDAEQSGNEEKVREAKAKKVETEKLQKKEVRFAVVDTRFWERWVRGTFDTARGPEKVVIYDYDVSVPSFRSSAFIFSEARNIDATT